MDLRDVLSRSRSPQPFPDSFIFGVANADHQVEAYDPELEDIRDVWERTRELEVRGRATDFWNRYEEDIELARKLGCTAFRFSVAWSRVEPAPAQFDPGALDHYRDLVSAIRSAGMQPILTLHHFTWPIHVEERGGMIADDFPAMFARYTTEVVNHFGQEVPFWVTFNEPSQLIYGYIKPWWESDYFIPPGLPEDATLNDQVSAIGNLIRNLFLAHTQARHIIRNANPEAQVGANPLLLGLPVWLQRWINRNATQIRSPDDLAKQVGRCSEQALLERGEVDAVVATLTRTAERARQVMFSETYFVAGQRLLVKADSPARDAVDLIDKSVAVVKTSTAEGSCAICVPGAQERVIDDYEMALRLLDQAKIDALLADDTILRGLMAEHPGQYKQIGGALTQEPYAAAVSLGNGQLLAVIDRVVQSFKESGAWAESYARHLGQPVPESPAGFAQIPAFLPQRGTASDQANSGQESNGPLPLAEKGTALRRIQDRGHLLVAVKGDMPGFGYRDPDTGQFSGLEIDLARAIAERIFGDPKAVRFRQATTQQRIPLLRSLLRLLDPIRKQYSILSTMLASNWWHLGMAGQLPEFLCPSECVGQQDYVGMDYYWGIRALRLDRIQRLIDAGLGHFDRAPVWPGALGGLLRYLASLFPDLPLLILENGSVDIADGVERATYIRRHVREVQRVVDDGVKVTGYICWSITSNREWGFKFGSGNDFGLHHIDLNDDPDLRRVPTPAATVYQEIITKRGV